MMGHSVNAYELDDGHADESRTTPQVSLRLADGVLVAKIEAQTLLQEFSINQIEESILQALPRARAAVVVDCSELTLLVSSQFLCTLVRIHREAKRAGLRTAVCQLSETLRAAYEVTALTSIIPSYADVGRAVADLGQVAFQEVSESTDDQSPSSSSPPPVQVEPGSTEWTGVGTPPRMSLHVVGGFLIAKVESDSLVDDEAIRHVESRILEVLAQAEHGVLLDCAALTKHVSSQFLTMLVRISKRAKKRAVKVAVCNPPPNLKSAYDVTALKALVPVYPNCASAMRKLGPSRDPFDDETADRWDRPRAAFVFAGLAIAGLLVFLLGVAAGIFSTLWL